MLRFDVINMIARQISAQSYLEIGVQRGETIGRVQTRERIGIDPNPLAPATYTMTSDAFFAQLQARKRFDLVFVDGLHTAEQVVRDVENAMQHLSRNGVIVVHDCDPPTAASAEEQVASDGAWCGTVWRGWLKLRRDLRGWFSAVVEADLGCGLLMRRRSAVPYPGSMPATWADLQSVRQDALNLISPEEFRSLVARLPPVRRNR